MMIVYISNMINLYDLCFLTFHKQLLQCGPMNDVKLFLGHSFWSQHSAEVVEDGSLGLYFSL